MLRRIGAYVGRHHLGLLALFVALGGTSYAATSLGPRNSVGSAQVVNGSLQSVDLSAKARKALKGRRGLRGVAGQQGVPGATGPSGAQGLPGAPGLQGLTGAIGATGAAGAIGATGPPGPGLPSIHGVITLNLAMVPPSSCITVALNIPNRQSLDHVLINPPGNVPVGIVVMPTIEFNPPDIQPATPVRICNVTTIALDPPQGSWGYVFFRN